MRVSLTAGRPPARGVMAVDAMLAVLFAVFDLWLAAIDTAPGAQDFTFEPSRVGGELVVVVVLVHLPLLWRQRHPLPVLGVIAAGHVAAIGFLGTPLGALPALATLYAVAAWLDWRVSATALVAFTLIDTTGWALADGGALPVWDDMLVALLVNGTAWGLGFTSRWRRLSREGRERAAERARKERAWQIVTDERARMARELHDILAHSISVMVLQASGGREVLAHDLDRAEEALAQIEATGRQSLTEVRRLLGVLHDAAERDVAREPGLARLDALVAQVTEAGVPTRLVVEGTPGALPPSADLAAYRVVQESLTNVLKHAGGARATVRITWSPETLRVEVRDDGGGGQAPATREGRGLAGMRERARLVGGEFAAGPHPGGGFLVSAALPLDGRDVSAEPLGPVPEARV